MPLEIVSLNARLKEIFDQIFYKCLNLEETFNKIIIKYLESQTIDMKNETMKLLNEDQTYLIEKLNKIFFVNPEFRMFILNDCIKILLDNEIPIKNDYINYYKMEDKVIDKTNEIKKQIDEYETSIKNIKKGIINKKEITNYIECVKNAYLNYKNNITSTTFEFYSREMDNSFYKDMKIDLSINEKQVIHLLGLPNENDNTNILSILYQEFKKTRIDVTFIEFVIKYSKSYINCFLYRDYNKLFSEETRNKINSIDKNITNNISNSFEKCLNFRKIYEYKFIPEIILDYESPKKLILEKYKNSEEQPHSYDNSSDAFTPLEKSKSKTLGQFIIEFSYLKEQDKEIIQNIIKYFPNNYDLLIEYNKNKSLFESENRIFKILDTKTDTQYKYNIRNHTLKSDLPVNVFLLSYDDFISKYELIQSKAYLLKSILIVFSIIKRKLNIGDKNIDYSKQLLNKVIESENISNKILRYNQILNKEDFEVLHELEKYIDNNLSSIEYIDLKRNKLISIDFIKKILDSKLVFTDQELDEYEKDLNQYIDLKEYENLELIIKSLISTEFKSKHFYNYFELFVTDDKIIEEQSKVQLFMPFAEYLKEKDGMNQKYDKTVSAIGFSVRRDMEYSQILEKYPKTFMGKTMLQVLTDLRVNGRNFKLDAIYEDNNNTIKYYSIIPLSSYGPNLKLKKKIDILISKTNEIDPPTKKK